MMCGRSRRREHYDPVRFGRNSFPNDFSDDGGFVGGSFPDRPRTRRSAKRANSPTVMRFSRAADSILLVSRRPARMLIRIMAQLRSGTAHLPTGRYRASWGKAGFSNSAQIRNEIGRKSFSVLPVFDILSARASISAHVWRTRATGTAKIKGLRFADSQSSTDMAQQIWDIDRNGPLSQTRVLPCWKSVPRNNLGDHTIALLLSQ